MIRAILYALISIFAITFLRFVMQIIMKGFGDAMSETTQGSRPSPNVSGKVPSSGELKGCKVCGTYVLTSAAKTDNVGGETVYYCSDDCKKKST